MSVACHVCICLFTGGAAVRLTLSCQYASFHFYDVLLRRTVFESHEEGDAEVRWQQ